MAQQSKHLQLKRSRNQRETSLWPTRLLPTVNTKDILVVLLSLANVPYHGEEIKLYKHRGILSGKLHYYIYSSLTTNKQIWIDSCDRVNARRFANRMRTASSNKAADDFKDRPSQVKGWPTSPSSALLSKTDVSFSVYVILCSQLVESFYAVRFTFAAIFFTVNFVAH